MTDKKTNTKNDAKRPDMIAYLVKPVGDDKSVWTPVGAAWQNKDGTSYTVQLDVLPITGRIQLHPRKEEVKQ